jgi:hypothetical protein
MKGWEGQTGKLKDTDKLELDVDKTKPPRASAYIPRLPENMTTQNAEL